jgi:hypothetical protein
VEVRVTVETNHSVVIGLPSESAPVRQGAYIPGVRLHGQVYFVGRCHVFLSPHCGTGCVQVLAPRLLILILLLLLLLAELSCPSVAAVLTPVQTERVGINMRKRSNTKTQ